MFQSLQKENEWLKNQQALFQQQQTQFQQQQAQILSMMEAIIPKAHSPAPSQVLVPVSVSVSVPVDDLKVEEKEEEVKGPQAKGEWSLKEVLRVATPPAISGSNQCKTQGQARFCVENSGVTFAAVVKVL